MLFHLAIVEGGTGALLTSYYFTPTAGVHAQDAWEGALAEEARYAIQSPCKEDVPLIVEDKFVLLRWKDDVVFILSGFDEHDELALVRPMDLAIECVRATCEKKLTPANVLAFHGKVCVCLNEMFFGGMLVHSSIETVLRNAKLKPLKF